MQRSLHDYLTGGPVRGPGTATSDSILARLSNGEYVLPKVAVDQVGVQNLDDDAAGESYGNADDEHDDPCRPHTKS